MSPKLPAQGRPLGRPSPSDDPVDSGPGSSRVLFPLAAKHREVVMQTIGLREQFIAVADAWTFAEGIVDTVREPVLVLDKELRVIAASRSLLLGIQGPPRGHRRKTALRAGRWTMGHPQASRAAGEHHTRARRDGGL